MGAGQGGRGLGLFCIGALQPTCGTSCQSQAQQAPLGAPLESPAWTETEEEEQEGDSEGRSGHSRYHGHLLSMPAPWAPQTRPQDGWARWCQSCHAWRPEVKAGQAFQEDKASPELRTETAVESGVWQGSRRQADTESSREVHSLGLGRPGVSGGPCWPPSCRDPSRTFEPWGLAGDRSSMDRTEVPRYLARHDLAGMSQKCFSAVPGPGGSRLRVIAAPLP